MTTPSRYDDRPNRGVLGWAIALIVLALLLGAAWWWWQGGAPASTSPRDPGPVVADGVPDGPVVTAPTQPPGVQFPIENVQPEPQETVEPTPPESAPQPLPALDESDTVLQQAWTEAQSAAPWETLLVPQALIRRIVATVDNLPREQVAQQVWPMQPPAGTFRATQAGEQWRIAPDNAARYNAHVQALTSVDTRRAVALYVRWYPLFQQAYRDLGYPQGNFNDRLVAVIDHLLATPTINEPLALTQPKVLYEFADPGLQARSAGQKLLLRMGPEHAGRVKAKLLEVRQAITGQARAPAGR